MKRLVPALLALLAGCGEPTIPERFGIEVGQEISVTYPAVFPGLKPGSGTEMDLWGVVLKTSGDWVQVKRWDEVFWLNLRSAASFYVE